MKRKNSRYQQIAFPVAFVRPSIDHQPNPFGLASASEQRGLRSKKIFVVKQVSRLESATGTHKKIQRIQIFDNHPDSLRLVLAGGASPDHDLSESQRVSSWELVLGSMLIMAALVGMFWPIF
jgi:hypothetical protein